MKKSPPIGGFAWVIVFRDNEPGTAQPKRVKVFSVTEVKGDFDPETASADFHGIRATDGDWYPWDEVFDNEKAATRYAASKVRQALAEVQRRLRANLSAERLLKARLEKLVHTK